MNKIQGKVIVESCRILSRLSGITLSSAAFNFDNKLPPKKLVHNFSKHHNCPLKFSSLRFKNLNKSFLPLAFKSSDNVYYILAKLTDTHALIQNVGPKRAPQILPIAQLEETWSKNVILTNKQTSKFDIRWFLPEFLRFKVLFSEVLFCSILIQVLALVAPLFFLVVMDKVLVHQSLSTLDVLVFVLLIAGIAEVILLGLRDYLLAHTTTRVDIKLGEKLFEHLVRLPLLYFKTRQVGSVVTRVRELDSIREFITGTTLTLLVDISFTFVFFAVMYYLSPMLTLVVLASIPLYVLVAFVSTKGLREKVMKQFQKGAKNTAFLTESVQGIETIKSLALEPRFNHTWDDRVKELAEANFDKQKLQTKISHSVILIQRLTSALVICLGAKMVIGLELTIGQLIAFNMMSKHVSQPMTKLVSLWQQFIQTKVAVDNLGELLNQPTEQTRNKTKSFEIIGDIQFDNVEFTYQSNHPNVLKGLSFTIKPGEHVGIVGASGSGKSTVTRLIQKLYTTSAGKISIDGTSINNISTEHLRDQIGVVLQENELFNCSIRDNIALREPSSSIDKIIQVAKLSGAHEFILSLPMGYDTIISEGGRSLSGGQRQRIAIARSILTSPQILIFDEATSALDEESQAIIQENMKEICRNRTVITVAHRLSTIQHCDRIMVIEHGLLTADGHHNDLILTPGCYQSLWNMQSDFKRNCA